MLPADSVLTLQVEGQTGGWLPVDDTSLRAGVLNRLTPYFDVIGCTITRGSTVANILDLQWYHWNYSAIVTIKTRIGYASPDDARSIVASAFYSAGGAMPSISITSQGETQGPGVEQTGVDMAAGLEEILKALREGAGLDALTKGAQTTLILVAVGIVGIVWLVAYGPNVRHVAAAVPRV